jgi:3-oxoacyl-[acyl-carrier protein] reductase
MVAVVSGGGSGVGRATTRALADAGAEVLIVGRAGDVLDETAREIEAEIVGSSVTWLEADLCDPDGARRVVDHLATTYGVLDAIVACADGAAGRPALDLAQLAGAWRATFDRDVLGAVLLTYGVAPLLRRPGGRIVLVRPPSPKAGGGAVDAAAGALTGWLASLAAEFGPEGITANVVSPSEQAATEPFGLSDDEPERIARALGAAGRSDDVAGVIRFLVSPDAASVTGQVIGVAGAAPAR